MQCWNMESIDIVVFIEECKEKLGAYLGFLVVVWLKKFQKL